jgi:ATP-dependent Lon protease
METKNFIPTLILKNTVLMPGTQLPILVQKDVALNAVNKALSKDSLIYVTTMKDGKDLELATPFDFYDVGTLSLIEKVSKNDKGETIIYIRSIDRYSFTHVEFEQKESYWKSVGEIQPDQLDLDSATESALLKNLKEISNDILTIIKASSEFKESLNQFDSVAEFTNVVCQNLPLILSKKQEILEITSIKNRALKILELLVEQRESPFCASN